MKMALNSLLVIFLIVVSGCIFFNKEKYLKDLGNDNVMVRYEAICKLGEKKEKSAVSSLVKLLADSQPKVIRLTVIEALGKIGQEEAVSHLVSVLDGKDSEIRTAACDALGQIGSAKAVSGLAKVSGDKDIQPTAIWALGNIGDPGAVPALAKLLDDQDKYVRFNAYQALKKLSSGQ